MNFEVDWAWVESLGIRFHLGIDGISIWLVMLTTFLMPIVFLSTWSAIGDKVREFVVATLILKPACSARSWRSTCLCSTCSGK